MSSDQIDPNNKLESLKFISQTHRTLFENRIKRTWKYVFSTMTFYVLCAGAKFGTPNVKLPLDSCLFQLSIWIIFLGLAALAGTSLWSEGKADNINRDIAENAENEIINILKNNGINTILPDNKQNVHPNQLQWLWQTAIISIFAISSALLITVF